MGTIGSTFFWRHVVRFCWCVSLGLTWCNPLTAQEEEAVPPPPGETFDLKRSRQKCVFDSVSGSIITLDNMRMGLTRYPPEYFDASTHEEAAQAIITADAIARPELLALKQWKDKTFVIGLNQGGSNQTISLYTADDLKLVKRIYVDFNSPSIAVAPGSDDPSVYFSVRSNPRQHDSSQELRRLDMSDFKVSRLVTDQPYNPEVIGVSADGGSLYLQQRLQTWVRVSPTIEHPGAHEPVHLRVSDSLSVFNSHSIGGVGPFGHYLATSNGALVELGTGTQTSSGDFYFLSFHPAAPCWFGWTGFNLRNTKRSIFKIHCLSSLREKELGSISLPDDHPVLRRGRAGDPAPAGIEVFCDKGRGKVLLCGVDCVHVVPEKVFSPENEPMAFLKITGPRRSLVGDSVRISVESPSPEVSCKLVRAPAGIELDNGIIAWSGEQQLEVGTRKFSFEVSSRNLEFVQKWQHTIQQPSCQIPFFAQNAKLSPNGEFLILWGAVSPPMKMRVALVSTKRPITMIGDLRFMRPISDLELTNDKLLLAEEGKGAVDIYDLPSLERVFTRFVGGEPVAFRRLATGQLVVFANRNNSGGSPGRRLFVKHFSTETNRFVDPPGLMEFDKIPVGIEQHWATEDWVLDPSMEKQTLRLPTVGDSYRYSRRWGLTGTKRSDGSSLSLGPHGGFAVSKKYPVALTYSRKRALGIHDVDVGNLIKSVVIDPRPTDRGEGAIILNHGGTIYIHDMGTVWKYDTSEELLSSRQTPLYFEPVQSGFIVKPDGKNTFTHVVRGGTPPYEFALRTNKPGLEIDQRTGQLTVDWNSVAARHARDALYLDIAKRQLVRFWADGIETRSILKDVKGRSNRYVSTPPGGSDDEFYFPFDVSIAAVGKEGRTASLDYSLCAEIPVSLIDEAVKKNNVKAEELKRARTQKRAEQIEKQRNSGKDRAGRHEDASLAERAKQAKEEAEAKRNWASVQSRLDTVELRLRNIEDELSDLLTAVQASAKEEDEDPEEGSQETADPE